MIWCGAAFLWGSASFSLYAQDTTPIVRIEHRTGSSVELIERLEQASGWVISYSSRLCERPNITLSAEPQTLLKYLEEIFNDCPFSFLLRENRIILQPLQDRSRNFTISGFVRDSLLGESLPAANLFDYNIGKGVISNNYGFFSITLPNGAVDLNVSYVGYKPGRRKFNLQRDTVIFIDLAPNLQLQEVLVYGMESSQDLTARAYGGYVLPMENIRQTPVLFGETDLVKSIQMLPGIQGGSEGFSGLYVRGGGPDQNLILLDDVPVYNVGHLLGFYSVFNTDIIKHVTVYKGSFPARYSGRLSSVIDIKMIDGNKEKIRSTLNVGLLSSSLALDGPIKKGKSAFALSFRRTYLDLFAWWIQRNQDETSNYFFYDVNAKYNYDFSLRNKLYFSFYYGRDKYYTTYNSREVEYLDSSDKSIRSSVEDNSNIGWGNLVGALRWNSVWTNKLFSNLTVTYSDYVFFIGLESSNKVNDTWESYEQRYLSGVKDYSAKIDFDYYPARAHFIKFGAGYIRHIFNPGIDIVKRDIDSESPTDATIGDLYLYGGEWNFYLEDDFTIGKQVRINMGVSGALFRSGDEVYRTLEPRLAVAYSPVKRWTFRSSYTEMSQYMHIVSSSSIALPTDLWLPVTDRLPPMTSQQISSGIDYNPGEKRVYSLSLDGYVKRQKNLLHYKESTSFFDYSTEWEDKLTLGDGLSFGAELYLQKLKGRWQGWTSYTIAKTTNTFPDLNDGEAFPTRFDRRHDFKINVSYNIRDNIRAYGLWQYGSGMPVTLPNEKYYTPNLPYQNTPSELQFAEDFGKYNDYRMPDFHRLDLGVSFTKKRSRSTRIWDVGVVNAYGRQNPFMLYFSNDDGDEVTSQRNLKQLSILPIPIPFVRYTLKF
ncbi:TonB-dependent receptor [Geofilum sp. OHC36d9]|uniref:TonB-dependent receptor n=1 Tax=Geofilum sp. OHC36d9 TaxID=3458413 RepID=UPI004033AB52